MGIAVLFFGTLILAPRAVTAFWPFSSARASSIDLPVLHDSTLPLLAAAINPDPNPNKGERVLALSLDSALIDTSGPEGNYPDQTDSSTPLSGGAITTYTVKSGDSLSEIASKYGVSMNTILWANDIKDAKLVKPGTSLIILPVSGIQHTVLKGETLSSLAKKYTADANDIAAFNGLADGSALTSGTEIIIPGGEITASKPSTKSTVKKTAVTSASTKIKIKTGGSLAQVLKNPYKGGSGEEIDGYYVNPAPGARVTQGIHGWNGIDLGAPNGTPVYAAAAGTVTVSKVGGWNGGYGNYVVISHANGTQTLYSHLSSDLVSVGESVTSGERIGGVGISGAATGYHLHFEVRGARNPFAGCELLSYCSPQ